VTVEGRMVTVNLVEDPLQGRIRHEVNDVHQRAGFADPDLLRRLLGEPVELGHPVIEEGENQDPAIRSRGRAGRTGGRFLRLRRR
jgi:hypothetical protein